MLQTFDKGMLQMNNNMDAMQTTNPEKPVSKTTSKTEVTFFCEYYSYVFSNNFIDYNLIRSKRISPILVKNLKFLNSDLHLLNLCNYFNEMHFYLSALIFLMTNLIIRWNLSRYWDNSNVCHPYLYLDDFEVIIFYHYLDKFYLSESQQ